MPKPALNAGPNSVGPNVWNVTKVLIAVSFVDCESEDFRPTAWIVVMVAITGASNPTFNKAWLFAPLVDVDAIAIQRDIIWAIWQ